ncbi:MAG TPA: helix-turn-helix transcriptional regulator [Rugosimonospora sp.]|nr:helix-turn-helix transcriptional regulator [Rugosimonospora sp.]
MGPQARETVTERHWTCSRRLRERRRELGLTQAEVIARMGGANGLTNRSLSTMEHGRRIDVGWLPELATALECTITYLLGLTDDPRRWEPGAPVPAAAPAPPDPPDQAQPHQNWILSPQLNYPTSRAP